MWRSICRRRRSGVGGIKMGATVMDSGTRFLRIIATYRHDVHFVFLQQHTLCGSFFDNLHTPATYVPRSDFPKMPAPFLHLCTTYTYAQTGRWVFFFHRFWVLSLWGRPCSHSESFSTLFWNRRSYVACIFKIDLKSIVTTNLGSLAYDCIAT